MLSVRAIYDGKNIHFLENISFNEPREIIITFLNKTDINLDKINQYQMVDNIEYDITSNEIQALLQNGGALKFLANEEEDIYSDKDLKIKYK